MGAEAAPPIPATLNNVVAAVMALATFQCMQTTGAGRDVARQQVAIEYKWWETNPVSLIVGQADAEQEVHHQAVNDEPDTAEQSNRQ